MERLHLTRRTEAWELLVTCERGSYHLYVSGNAGVRDTMRTANGGSLFRNGAQFFRDSLSLSRQGKIAADDAVVRLIKQILSNEPAIRKVHREE